MDLAKEAEEVGKHSGGFETYVLNSDKVGRPMAGHPQRLQQRLREAGRPVLLAGEAEHGHPQELRKNSKNFTGAKEFLKWWFQEEQSLIPTTGTAHTLLCRRTLSHGARMTTCTPCEREQDKKNHQEAQNVTTHLSLSSEQ